MLIQANFDISNSDMSNYCAIVLVLIVYLKRNAFLESNYGCWDPSFNSELPEVQIHLHFGYFELVKIVPTTSIIEI